MPIQNEKLRKFASEYEGVLGTFADDAAVLACIREICQDSLRFAMQHGLQDWEDSTTMNEIIVLAGHLQNIKISPNQESAQESSVN